MTKPNTTTETTRAKKNELESPTRWTKTKIVATLTPVFVTGLMLLNGATLPLIFATKFKQKINNYDNA